MVGHGWLVLVFRVINAGTVSPIFNHQSTRKGNGCRHFAWLESYSKKSQWEACVLSKFY